MVKLQAMCNTMRLTLLQKTPLALRHVACDAHVSTFRLPALLPRHRLVHDDRMTGCRQLSDLVHP